MQIIIYEKEKINRSIELLENMTVTGIKNFRLLSELVAILKSGKQGDYKEQKEDLEDVMESKEIQSN